MNIKNKKMNNRERFDFMKNNFPNVFKLKAEEALKNLVNFLIDSLYVPIKGEIIKKVDKNRLKRFKISEDEPINWWNLKCKEVNPIDNDNFLVKIEEAEKNSCDSFCHYIESFMFSYGWKCHVETEW
jgi:hypothetical protein